MDPDITDPGLDVHQTDFDDPDPGCDPEPWHPGPGGWYDQGMDDPLSTAGVDQTSDVATGQALYESLLVPLGGGQWVWTETPNIDLFSVHDDVGGDGIFETAALQVEINGRIHEAWASDLTHDRVADVVFIDSDGDGVPNVALLHDGAGGWQQIEGSWIEPAPEPRLATVRPPTETGNPLTDIGYRYEATFTETAIAHWQHYLGDHVPYPVGEDGYAVSGFRGFMTLLEQHGHLLTEEQVAEIGRIVGHYHQTWRAVL